MHLSKCLFPFLFAGISCLELPARGQETSKVIPEHTSIYSEPSAEARVTGTLEGGDRVHVDVMITGSDGSWCLVREAGGKNPAGYVGCRELTREALPKAGSAVREVPQSTESLATPDRARNDSSTAGPTYDAEFHALEWAAQLDLTEDQHAAVAQLLVSSGLAACRDDLEKTYRRYGITDAYSLLQRTGQWGHNPLGDSFAATVEPKIRRGAARYKSFWQALWKMLTPEQRTKAKHINGFLLAYIGSQSDPESAFSGSVLQHMRQGQ
jgi:hypothetical protein